MCSFTSFGNCSFPWLKKLNAPITITRAFSYKAVILFWCTVSYEEEIFKHGFNFIITIFLKSNFYMTKKYHKQEKVIEILLDQFYCCEKWPWLKNFNPLCGFFQSLFFALFAQARKIRCEQAMKKKKKKTKLQSVVQVYLNWQHLIVQSSLRYCDLSYCWFYQSYQRLMC